MTKKQGVFDSYIGVKLTECDRLAVEDLAKSTSRSKSDLLRGLIRLATATPDLGLRLSGRNQESASNELNV